MAVTGAELKQYITSNDTAGLTKVFQEYTAGSNITAEGISDAVAGIMSNKDAVLKLVSEKGFDALAEAMERTKTIPPITELPKLLTDSRYSELTNQLISNMKSDVAGARSAIASMDFSGVKDIRDRLVSEALQSVLVETKVDTGKTQTNLERALNILSNPDAQIRSAFMSMITSRAEKGAEGVSITTTQRDSLLKELQQWNFDSQPITQGITRLTAFDQLGEKGYIAAAKTAEVGLMGTLKVEEVSAAAGANIQAIPGEGQIDRLVQDTARKELDKLVQR